MVRSALGPLLIILPLTLGLRSAETSERTIDTRRLALEATHAVKEHGWSVRPTEHHLIGWLVEGKRRDCRILVHFPPAEGSTDEMFKRLAKPVGPVTYQYRGQTSGQFPRFAPMLARHVQRYLGSFGVELPTPPVIAVAQSPSCAPQLGIFIGLRQHLHAATAS